MPILTEQPHQFQLHRRHRPTRYYPCVGFAGTTTGVIAQGQMYLTPFWVPEGGLYDRIACEIVTPPGEAGAVVRMGAYEASQENCVPLTKAPIFDAGVVAADAVAMVEITISQWLQKGLTWLTAVPQVCPVTGPTMRYSTAANGYVPLEGSSGGFPSTSGSWRATGVTGALPTQPCVFTGVAGTSLRMWMRKA